jgi:hypothetical protein
MSSVVDTVSDFAGDVVDTVGDIGQSVIDAGSQVVDTVGTAVSDVAQTVGEAAADMDKAVSDNIPGGWATIGAVALTIATAGTVDLEGETMAADIAAEGSTGAGAVGEGAATAGEVAGEGAAAAGEGGSGLTSGAVDATLNEGLNGTQAALEAAGKGAIKGAAIGAAKSAITGGDVVQGALTGAVAGGLGGGIGNYASGLTEGTDLADYAKAVGAVAGGTAAGAGSAAINGADPLTGALIGGIAGGAGSVASNLMPVDVNPAITSAGLGAIKAGLTGGDPLMGGLTAAGGSLLGQGANAGYDAGKEFLTGLNLNDTNTPASNPEYDKLVAALGGSKEAADAWLQGQNADVQKAYAPVTGVTTEFVNSDVPTTNTPLVTPKDAFPDKSSPTGFSNNDGQPVNEDGSAYKSPLDELSNPSTGGLPNTTNDNNYIPNPNPALDNRDVGNGENPDPNYVAPQIPGETIGDGSGSGSGSSGSGNINAGGSSGVGAGIAAGVGGLPAAAKQLSGQNASTGLMNLTPGLTHAMNSYSLAGLPSVQTYSTGGSTTNSSSLFDDKGGYNYSNTSDTPLTPALTKHNVGYTLTGLPTFNKAEGGLIAHMAGGGQFGSGGNYFGSSGNFGTNEKPEYPQEAEHKPRFYSEGGASMAHRYVKGDGDGTSDSVPAMLANGEFVIPADVVSNLGNGSNDSGAKILDEFLRVIREHKRKADAKHLPPDSKGPLSYLTDAKRKARK